MQDRPSYSESSRRFVLNTATIALECGPRKKIVTIPCGEIVKAATKRDDAQMMVEVEWGERRLLMFEVDLLNRGKEI